MLKENKDIIRRLIETFDAHDLGGLDDLVTDDFVWHGGSFGETKGREEFKQLVGAFFTAFPDLRIELGDLIAEGDMVAARWITTGTQEGELSGVPPSGKRAKWGEQPVYRLAAGKVAEAWWVGDALGLMQQIGAIPSPA